MGEGLFPERALEILELEKQGDSNPAISKDSRECGDVRDSGDPFSEKTPLVVTLVYAFMLKLFGTECLLGPRFPAGAHSAQVWQQGLADSALTASSKIATSKAARRCRRLLQT